MIVLDTGTADPDDILTIGYLATRGLAAVTLYPGTDLQVGLIRAVLDELGLQIPVGGSGSPKDCVSRFYAKCFKYEASKPDGLNSDIIKDFAAKGAKILTCEAPFNLDGLDIDKWYAQGGYAPHELMDPDQRLAKFTDVKVCQSFNFGSPSLINRLIARSKWRQFVSKNVCHGVVYDRKIHETMPEGFIKRVMDIYLKEHEFKAFHDILAAATMLDPSICQFKEVQMYNEQNRWGCFEKENTNTFISVGVDKEKFWKNVRGS